MDEQNKALLLFQLGPVQEFIAQAANPEDLWAGSYVLSRLMLAGLDKALEHKAELIFPNLSDGTVRAAMTGVDKIPTIPNRFLAEVDAEMAETVAEEVKKAVKARLDRYVQEVELPPGGQTQADQFLQMTWAVLPKEHRSDDLQLDYKTVSGILAVRRNLRDFAPWRESVATGPKDFLSGKETALDRKSRRGALNRLKLDLPKIEQKSVEIRYPDDDKYIAVVAMDGDKMGERLSGFKMKSEHLSFSANLAKFAVRAIEIVQEKGGSPIYVGGDDVLAVFPAKLAVEGARNLYKEFVRIVGGTASAGLAVGHKTAPLQDLVTLAHASEHKAKHVYDRDALVVNVYKRSGENVSWGGKWNSKGIDVMIEFRSIFEGEMFKRFPYKLAALLQPYELEKLDSATAGELAGVIEAEYCHAWRQCAGSEVEGKALDLVKSYFAEVSGGLARAEDFLNAFLCETFINRPRNEKEDDE